MVHSTVARTEGEQEAPSDTESGITSEACVTMDDKGEKSREQEMNLISWMPFLLEMRNKKLWTHIETVH